MQTLLTVLLAIIILAGMIRLVSPFGMRVEGAVFLRTSIPLLARLRMHALPGLLAVAVTIVLVVLYGVSPLVLLVPLVAYGLLVAVPVSYVLTDTGIRIGWTRFRRWTEFAGVSRKRGGASLQGVHGRRSLRIWLSDSRGDDEFLHILRLAIRHAYKGRHRTEIVTFVDSIERIDDATTIAIQH